ncbi:MmpS family transport accessory protein [Mycolicibacterium sp. 050232]|uniref:MmpS family transport accessory protein n=1 Tax=Mycolicibacterium sp. 050232 TaxID=3113982 RepID=UPI002E28F53C|nr:MmpS family transport accessory protein [Mycolicibacterium sp. 050232]MED5813165.1 MmpS family transport accessory protein [Mycolicibacterium sp. 050232]
MNYPQGGNAWQQIPPPNMPPQPYPGQPYAPGYYAPPPPKKKKTWLWVLLALVVVCILIYGGLFAFARYQATRAVTVTYEVTGTGDTASVLYSVRDFDNVTTEESVDLPWSRDVEIVGGLTKAFQFKAQPKPGESVECKVTVNGKIRAQDRSTLAGKSAFCFGTA